VTNSPSAPALEARDLTFEYPRVRALDGVSFAVPQGSIAALVGPNGAGKSTLLRCLAALAQPFSGCALVRGVDTTAAPRQCHRLLGFLPDFYGLYDELTARRCLEYAARSRGIAPGSCGSAVERTAARLGLADRLEAKAGELSRGQRQALAIGQAVIHGPEVLLLDEPASGLDPEARRNLAGLLRSLRDGGMSILVSSHILAELEEYATGMIVLREGRITDRRSLGGAPAGGRALRLVLATARGDVGAVLAGLHGVDEVAVTGAEARFRFSGDAAGQHRVLRTLIDAGFTVTTLSETGESLQSAYFDSVRRTTRGGGDRA
jgi:ABC-2 type transport system ATP-binding protein